MTLSQRILSIGVAAALSAAVQAQGTGDPKQPKIPDPPKKEVTEAPPAAPTTSSPTASEEFRRPRSTNYFQSGLSPASSGSGGAAAGTAAAAAAVTNVIAVTPSQTPVVLPGLLTSANSEWARPTDRVFLSYSYFDRFQVATGAPPTLNTNTLVVTPGPVSRQAGFNLNRFDIGIEKTILDGRASIYARVPFINATDNVTGQALDGLSNVTGGFKYMFLENRETGSALTAGFSVSAPTGRDTTVATAQQYNFSFANGANIAALQPNGPGTPLGTSNVNPTYLQPWVAGLWIQDRFFVHEFFGALVSTDSRVPTFLNNDLALGFQLYRAEPGRLVSSLTPFIDAQALIPTSNSGSPAFMPSLGTVAVQGGTATTPPFANSANLSYPTQLFLSSGLSIGLGERALFTVSGVTPVVGPRAFNWGVTAGFNFYY